MHMPLEDSLGLNLLAANQHQAEHNREHFDAWRLLCLNVMSSPGAGKTSLLERTLTDLSARWQMAVLEGDMTTQLDAQRLEAVGVPVVPITTGRACHLAAACGCCASGSSPPAWICSGSRTWATSSARRNSKWGSTARWPC
jgi:hydrogenase nickel incorporation protein HypB